MTQEILQSAINEDLLKLRSMFQAKGFDIRIVGGAVRDILNGEVPKDIDLCTDATPDEQLAVYQENGLRYEETGIQHGTITVIMNSVGYEITTLRTESEHDGRYAKMAFTRDWKEDLSRRDLTINAISMTFDGEIFDPFNGQEDLKNKVVKFVGDPNERMREDYLRILRYFRFLGRVAGENAVIDDKTATAIRQNIHGLRNISAERIWSEVKRILAHKSGAAIYGQMLKFFINRHTALPGESYKMDHTKIERIARFTTDPITRLCAVIDDADHVDHLASSLKWSSEETKLAKLIVKLRDRKVEDLHFAVIVEGEDRRMVAEAARYKGEPFVATTIEITPPPVFPMTGKDIIATGVKPGPEVGEILRQLKIRWFNSGCKFTKGELYSFF